MLYQRAHNAERQGSLGQAEGTQVRGKSAEGEMVRCIFMLARNWRVVKVRGVDNYTHYKELKSRDDLQNHSVVGV